MRYRSSIAALGMSFVLSIPTFVLADRSGHHLPHSTFHQYSADRYYRTELYFGRSKPAGGSVTEGEWKKFLAEVVTPRFPDGFTILKGTGQYREKSGKIITEQSEVLVFLYRGTKLNSSRRKIEEIRKAYMRQFDQESVLRIDYPQSVDVRF